MKKAFCLILSLLLALPLLAGCNDATFLTDPAGEAHPLALYLRSREGAAE